MIRRLFAIAAAMLVCACVSTGPQRPVERYRLVDDALNRDLILAGPDANVGSAASEVHRHIASLNAAIDRKTGNAVIMIHHRIDHRFGSWLFFRGARYLGPSGAPELVKNFERARGDVGGCSGFGCTYTEQATFTVPEPHLREMVKAGPAWWKVRMEGERRELDFDYPGVLIVEFLQELDKVKARIAAGTKPASQT